jgi:hypothetical protein
MRTSTWSLAGKFHGVVDRLLAALHQQREIEARRALRRYGHLLETQNETLLLNKMNLVRSEKEVTENAHQSAARERPASYPSLERA